MIIIFPIDLWVKYGLIFAIDLQMISPIVYKVAISNYEINKSH